MKILSFSLLTLMLFKTSFFLLLNTKEDILKNVDNQTELMDPIDFFPTMEVNWCRTTD